MGSLFCQFILAKSSGKGTYVKKRKEKKKEEQALGSNT